MCRLCDFVEESIPCWTQMSYSTFMRLKGDACASWINTYQHHKLCFHGDHEGSIVTWGECGRTRLHAAFSLCVMHPKKDEPLPEQMDESSFSQKSKPAPPVQKAFQKDYFPICHEIRKNFFSKERQLFADKGYHSIQIPFSEDQEKLLRDFLRGIMEQSRTISTYYTGRQGYPVTQPKLKTLKVPMLRTILNDDLLHSALFYFGNDFVVYDVEVLRTAPFSTEQ